MDNREYRANLQDVVSVLWNKASYQINTKGMTDKEIKQVVFEENLFQYDKKSSITRAFLLFYVVASYLVMN